MLDLSSRWRKRLTDVEGVERLPGGTAEARAHNHILLGEDKLLAIEVTSPDDRLAYRKIRSKTSSEMRTLTYSRRRSR